MKADVQITLSFALSFGVPIAVAARELFLLRRDRRGPGRRDERPTLPTAPRPLPDCLVPRPMSPQPVPVRETREMERV